MKSARIYPLRTSSNEWKIKLYTNHICSAECAYINAYENYDSVSIEFCIENPMYKDGKCNYYGTNQISNVKISEFNKDIPKTINGYLLFSEQIVIPEQDIFVLIHFPIDHPIKIKINSSNELGFTLSDILDKIKNLYKWLYEEEERTTRDQEFLINIACECSFVEKKCIYQKEHTTSQECCSICLEKINDEHAYLVCKHAFHILCIEKWIQEGGSTCPLCRSLLIENCNKCNGEKWVKFYYKGKVLPRYLNIRRPKTYGRFGIGEFNFEDLVINDMTYNRQSRLLSLNIA